MGCRRMRRTFHMSVSAFSACDSEYKSFNQGAKKLAELLIQHGAKQHGEHKVHDASSGDLAEDLARPSIEGQVANTTALMEEA